MNKVLKSQKALVEYSNALRTTIEHLQKLMREAGWMGDKSDILLAPDSGWPVGIAHPTEKALSDTPSLVEVQPGMYVLGGEEEGRKAFIDMVVKALTETGNLGVFNLAEWSAIRLGVVPTSAEDFRIIVGKGKDGQPDTLYVELAEKLVPNDIALRELEFTPADTTLEAVAAANNAGSDEEKASISDEVDIVVKRKGE